jgi:putative SOS response-associated peptidase YedK
VILTQPAIGKLKEIHDRMPVMLSRDARREWLENGTPALKQTVTELAFEPATPKAPSNQAELF